MEELYKPYLQLTAGQRKLLCFMAYTDGETDKRLMSVYAKVEDLTSSQISKTLKSLAYYLRLHHYYNEEYDLEQRHVAPLLVYMLKGMPRWLDYFDKFYRSYQTAERRLFISRLRQCVEGKASAAANATKPTPTALLMPLTNRPEFLPLMLDVPPYRINNFVIQAVVFQVENDMADPHGILGKIAELGYGSMSVIDENITRSIVAFYDFVKQGRYDEHVASYNNLYSKMLTGLHALYRGDYETAFTQYVASIRERNKGLPPAMKGFYGITLNNYALVLAYHLRQADEHKKLLALYKKDGFSNHHAPFWLARYLLTGQTPTKRDLGYEMKSNPMRQYLALLMARFFQIDIEWPKQLPEQPCMHLLRHELSPWLSQTDEEKEQLAAEFGGSPLLARLRFKQRWELLLEELTPNKSAVAARKDEGQVRVAYIVNGERVEVREQSRLKSGAWGAGKRMSIDTFRRGTDFMDEADRRIAASISGWYSYDVGVEKVLPHLIGSDRVYAGCYAPFEPVIIDEEKPYLVIERTKTAFSVKSNLGDAKLDGSVVYRKHNDTHYTVITMTDRQRLYYKKLLSIGAFPLEAEPQLREFLPKVSDIVEVHSELVEGGTTLEHRDGTGQLCLQVMPTAGTRNLFNVYCVARPLPDGTTLFEPGKGLNPCVAEQDGVRYQVTRDMKGERANIGQLRTFIEDSEIMSEDLDEPFADRKPVMASAEGLLQLMQYIQEQKEQFYMEWPEGGQIKLKGTNTAKWDIMLKSKNGWFEVEGNIPIDDETVLTVGQLLDLVAASPQNGFIRLNDSEFLAISDRLRKQLARLESLTVSNRGHLQISELHASLLGSALSGEVEVKHDKKIDELQKTIKKSMALQPAIPRQLKAELRDYQTDGYQWLVRMTGWGAGLCLADDMGLGKTVQTIAFMLHVAEEGPALVAAPASVVPNWRRELERFAPSLHVVVLNSAPDRKEAILQATGGDVVLTTYGLFVTESEQLLEKQWNVVCLDEAHVIKNRETKTSASVMKLQAKNRIILTGTPVQNHLGELWNLYQFINPGLLGSYEQFQKKYIVPIELQDNKERSRQLKRIVAPFILRRTKQEVIEELPDKTEITMPVELSDEELGVYEVIRRRAKQLLEDEQGSAPSVNTLAEITRLRQAACAAQLAEKSWKGECSKINALTTLLEEIVGGGNQVLVFSQFTSFLALVRKALDKLKMDYIYLDGAVPMKKREQLVSDFQHGRHPIFLISLKAGGLGLNLTGANYVIHMDPWWNPAIEQQATDRAYRIGQRLSVTVYHLIAQHTIEEKILRLHETKRNLADAMLSGTSESHKLTSKELLQMIGGE